MKFLLYSDMHVRPERLEDCRFALRQILALAQKHKVDFVVNGGDTFHTRGLIRTSCFDALYSEWASWFNHGIKQVVIVGNHDQEDHAGDVHPMKVFSGWNGWRVVDRPSIFPEIPNSIFFPYMNELSEGLLDKYAGMDAFVHWGIRGAKRNDSNTDSDGVPVEFLKNFRRVFSGHYHYRNQFENVQYIGSPFQQDFGELGQSKGVLIYDNTKEEVSFEEIQGTPKHFKVKVGWNEKGDIYLTDREGKEIDEKSFVQVEVEGDAESVNHITREDLRRVLGFDSHNISIRRAVKDKAFSRLNIEASERHSYETLMSKYLDFIETDLDKKRLLEVGREIIGWNTSSASSVGSGGLNPR